MQKLIHYGVKVKVKAYWTRLCASKVRKRCLLTRGETVKNWDGSRVGEK